jgi:uncharacterized spore protein YtfJ
MEATMFDELVGGVRDLVTAKRVYGDWYEKDGLTVIPAATVRGGGGGGAGRHGDEESGRGGGVGVMARPAGAWIIEGRKVRWKPAIDPNRIVLGAQIIALTAIVVRGGVLRAQLRHARRSGPSLHRRSAISRHR